MQKIFLLMGIVVAALAVAAGAVPAVAADDSFPRYASLKSGEVNVRAGPGMQYPILWVFKRRSWPVELTAEYQRWYRIRDLEGEEGWVHKALISPRRTAVITGSAPALMSRKPDGHRVLYELEPGVIVTPQECGAFVCRVEVRGKEGWVAKARLAPID